MRWPWNRRRRQTELDEEIESHLRMAVQDRIGAGESGRDAEAAARREFGNVGLVKDVTREMWGSTFLANVFKDASYGLRALRKSPGFTSAAVLSLALGIGGTTAIFSLIHAVMLRSLPVADPAALYRFGDGSDCCVESGPQDRWGMYSFALFQRLKAAAPEFEQVAAFQAKPWQFGVRRVKVETIARPLNVEFVTGNYFSTLGIQAFAGRVFLAEDDKPASAPVAVLSYRVWRDAYAGDASVVGSTFLFGDHAFTVIGVAPPGFFGETLRSDPPDVWLPLQQELAVNGETALLRQSAPAWLRVIGRLRPGATIDGLSARLTGVLRQWLTTESGLPAALMPSVMRLLPRQTITVVPSGSGVAEMKEDYGRSLQILLSVCCLVLLIACANVANLLLARSAARRTDAALRLAIGASARRLIFQSLTESVLLSLAGGVAGLAVAYGANRLLLALAFHSARFIPISTTPSIPALAFTFGLSLLTGVFFAIAPAWFATHADPIDALRGAQRSTREVSSFSRSAFLVVQATLSVVLVAGAVMLARSLSHLEHQNLGFQTEHRIAVELNGPPASYPPDRLTALYASLQNRLQQLPGVERAELAGYNPFTGNWGDLIAIPGREAPVMSEQAGASWDRVSAGYLDALGVPVLRGRGFTAQDAGTSAPVAVVNQTFAKRFFPGQDPLGKHFGLEVPANAGTFQIVGVIRDEKFTQPQAPVRPMFFVSLPQYVHYKEASMQAAESGTHRINGILIETRLPVGSLEPVLKKAIADVDSNLTVINIRTMQDLVALNFDQQRAVATLAELFGLVALVLAAVGLYGVTAYSVALRTSEIGIRMALGASRASIMRLVLGSTFRRAALGLLLGIPLALGAGRLLSSQLYESGNWDPAALMIAALSLAVCAFIAAILPASRAASIEPTKALRAE